jgi:hypothetical protein
MKNLLYIFLAITLAGCQSNYSTNKGADVNVGLASSLNKANIEVKELIRGKGCSGSFLGIFRTGDTRFLSQNNINTSNDEGKAKAAAAYNALYGDQSAEINTDIIVNPVYHVESKGFFIGKEVCASVVGYRGVITSWEAVDRRSVAP